MADSYQKEIPKNRIQITIDLYTGGAQERTELLMAGDFSRRQGPGGACRAREGRNQQVKF
ncbi:hypothetical protein R75461_07197 [Paraburkholderia nemoris]|nr:hypothetical protein R75461_07197 [Paraburkholderia nemoris]